MSPIANTSGCPGRVRSASTVTRPARSRSAPVSSASLPARPDAVTPAAQTTARLAMRSAPPSRPSSVTPAASIPITVRPVRTVTPRRCSDRSAFADSEGGKLVSTRSAASTSRMRARRGSMVRKSRRSVSRASSAIWPAISTPVGAGADDDEREPRVACRCVRLALGGLEGGEEPAANGECTLERLDLGGVQPPFLVAEVRVVRAAGDDQRVVAEPFRRRHRPDGAQVQLTRVEVEVGDLGQQDADVAVALEDRAERIGDLAGRERPGRDLVGERLEEMEVAAVDERDLDRRTPQLRAPPAGRRNLRRRRRRGGPGVDLVSFVAKSRRQE